MASNFLSSSSILKKFLVFNFIVFLVLSVFTFLYLQDIEPNLVNNRSEQHDKIIKNKLSIICKIFFSIIIDKDIKKKEIGTNNEVKPTD